MMLFSQNNCFSQHKEVFHKCAFFWEKKTEFIPWMKPDSLGDSQQKAIEDETVCVLQHQSAD